MQLNNLIEKDFRLQEAQKKAFADTFTAKTGVEVLQDGPTDYGKLKAMVESGNVAWDVVDVEMDFAIAAAKLASDGRTVMAANYLPHTLVAAFRATLEEAVQADVLLHVVDASSPTRVEQIAAVNTVLAEIGAAELPQIVVYNKIDLCGDSPRVERDEYGKICAVRISAQTGAGLDLLRSTLEESAAATRTLIARSAAA